MKRRIAAILVTLILFQTSISSAAAENKTSSDEKNHSLLVYQASETNKFVSKSSFPLGYGYKLVTEIPVNDETFNNGLSFQLIGSTIYFWNSTARQVEFMNLQGKTTSLIFTSGSNSSFIVSKDNRKIAWIEESSKGNKVSYSILISDINGSNKEKLYAKELDTLYKLRLIRWSADNKSLYFGKCIDGIGGAIVYEFTEDLNKMDTGTKKVTHILGKDRKYNNSDYISALSANEDEAAYFETSAGNRILTVYNIKTKKKVSIPIPYKEKEIRCYGCATFSDDNSRVAFELALEKNGDDGSPYTMTYMVADLKNKSMKAYNTIFSIPYMDLVYGLSLYHTN